jgi:hypothetical protein
VSGAGYRHPAMRLPKSRGARRGPACLSAVSRNRAARRSSSGSRSHRGARCQRQGLTDTEPGFNTVPRYMRNPELTPYVEQLVRASDTPPAELETTVAPDSTAATYLGGGEDLLFMMTGPQTRTELVALLRATVPPSGGVSRSKAGQARVTATT